MYLLFFKAHHNKIIKRIQGCSSHGYKSIANIKFIFQKLSLVTYFLCKIVQQKQFTVLSLKRTVHLITVCFSSKFGF